MLDGVCARLRKVAETLDVLQELAVLLVGAWQCSPEGGQQMYPVFCGHLHCQHDHPCRVRCLDWHSCTGMHTLCHDLESSEHCINRFARESLKAVEVGDSSYVDFLGERHEARAQDV